VKLNINYKVLITEQYYAWYHTDAPDNPPEGREDHMTIGEVAKIVNPANPCYGCIPEGVTVHERLISTLDDRVSAIVPIDVLEEMRKAFLERGKVRNSE
jgi:hypothetical protein